MWRRVGLVAALLIVPCLVLGASYAIDQRLESDLREGLRKAGVLWQASPDGNPKPNEFCVKFPTAAPELCGSHDAMTWLRRGSFVAGGFSLLILVAITIAGRLARRSRWILYFLFRPGMYVVMGGLAVLTVLNGVLAAAGLYYLETTFTDRLHLIAIGSVAVGGILGAIAIADGAATLIGDESTSVNGRTLSRPEAPELWRLVSEQARRLGVAPPENLIVGLDPTFFATEAPVDCSNDAVTGRTVYCSLPFARLMTTAELSAVVGHELGHFRAADVTFGRRFASIYRGTSRAIESLEESGADSARSASHIGALAMLRYFLEAFAIAEKNLSRERELAADAAGAELTAPRTMAVALVKVHAFEGAWHAQLAAATSEVRQNRRFTNLSRSFATAAAETAGPPSLADLLNRELPHPIDSHPPLAARLQSLKVALASIGPASLDVSPATPASALVPALEAVERELSEHWLRAASFSLLSSKDGWAHETV